MSGIGTPFYALAAAISLMGCSPGGGGTLHPVEAAGVTIAEDSATISSGPLSAQVTARWSEARGQSMMIRYTNSSKAAARIAVADLKMTHSSGAAILTTAVDYTGVNMTDARTDNDRGRILFEVADRPDRASVLDIPGGATRVVDADLSNFTDKGFTVKTGDRITATVPMAGRNVDVVFTAKSPPKF